MIGTNNKLDKDAAYRLTEWEWLKLQLTVFRFHSEMLSTSYEFRDGESRFFEKTWAPKPAEIACMIFGRHTTELLRLRKSREEQLEYYRAWMELERAKIERAAKSLPTLKRQFDSQIHVAFVIMHHYGMGSSRVCMFWRDVVTWFAKGQPEDRHPA